MDYEIRREAREGKLELTKKPDESRLNKSLSQGKSQTRKPLLSKPTSVTHASNALNYTSLRRKQDPENLLDCIRIDENSKMKPISYSSTCVNQNMNKIQKFIEKQKKRNAQKRHQEKTEETAKYLRVRQNLTNLHNYTTNLRVKTGAHSRQTSVNASLALPNQSLRVEGSEGRQQLKAFRGERKKSASKQRREQAKILANLSSYGKIDENG